ncbi:hypothetical protein [Caldimonas tepidiphila]|uniref:hypothetical protein n=1 Tax=Caldimonas tepidiphila TaxID=2315841 RepID=UPI000E5AFA63|nr:hypothetical protein [Caldimonas tepidiphila]
MRVLLALLLCLAIPLQGFANAHAFADQPCPMEQAAYQAASDMAAMEADCCNDAETAGTTGKTCKTGQDCKLAQAFLVLPPVGGLGRLPPSSLVPAPPGLHPSSDPSSVWRPPTLS